MVDKTPAIPNASDLTEHERRLKRAARFGLDPEQVTGPQMTDTGYGQMDMNARGHIKS